MSVRFQPFDPVFLQDPYPTYAQLRDQSPVHRVRIGPVAILRMLKRFSQMRREAGQPGLLRTAWQMRRARGAAPRGGRGGMRRRLYAVSTHSGATFVLRHPELFSSSPMGGGDDRPPGSEPAPTDGSLISLDPPEHGGHRAIVNRGFTPRRIAALEQRIRELADELIADCERGGEVDLVERFTNPLPVAVIAELLGLDPARRDDFKRWSTALIIGSTGGQTPRFELFREFRSYMTEIAEERRDHPGGDLISLLVGAERDEGVLDAGQVVGFASLLLAAGSETTTNLVGNALLALRDHPEQAALVREEPARIPALIEETLRFDSPVQLLMRMATQDTEIEGDLIPEGALVMAVLGAANRDESVFERGEHFDLTRGAQGHLAFGLGNHFCLGASLARLEARVALETLLLRYPDWQIPPGPIERHGSFLVRGPVALPFRFGPRS